MLPLRLFPSRLSSSAVSGRFLSTSPFLRANKEPVTSTGHPSSPASPSSHVTDKPNELDIQSGASKAGKRDRMADGSPEASSAATERDVGGSTKRAEEEHPEAPGPVLGMQDERGRKGNQG